MDATAGESADRHILHLGKENGYEPKVFKFCYRQVSCVTMLTLQEDVKIDGSSSRCD
jgi:hypothetical protein